MLGKNEKVIDGVRVVESEIYPGYWISENGEVWSSHKNNFRKLKIKVNRGGYCLVNVRKFDSTKWKSVTIHRLVLETFVGDKPPNFQCRHKDGNKSNNNLNNIEWNTAQINHDDMHLHGTRAKGERIGPAKLTEKEILLIRQLLKTGRPQIEIAEDFQITQGHVSRIKRRVTWMHIP